MKIIIKYFTNVSFITKIHFQLFARFLISKTFEYILFTFLLYQALVVDFLCNINISNNIILNDYDKII